VNPGHGSGCGVGVAPRVCAIVLAALTVTGGCAPPGAPDDSRPRPPAPIPSNRDFAGQYTVTITAEQSCSALPPSVRTRTYVATVQLDAPESSYFVGVLGGATFLEGYGEFSISQFPRGNNGGDGTVWWMSPGEGGDAFEIFEKLSAAEYVSTVGIVDIPTDWQEGSPLTFDGTLSYCDAYSDIATFYLPCQHPVVSCRGDQLTLTLQ